MGYDVGDAWRRLTGNIGKRGASIGHLGKNKPNLNQCGQLVSDRTSRI